MRGFFTLFALLFLTVGASYFFIKKNESAKVSDQETCGDFGYCAKKPNLINYVASLRASIVKIVVNHRKNVHDLSALNKINYSLPNTHGYQENSEFGLFSPQGGGAKVYDHSSLSSNPVIIFTFGNRVKGLGSSKSELMFLMPGILLEVCENIEKFLNNGKVESIQKLNIESAPKEIESKKIVDLPYKQGCIEVKGGRYFYSTLIER